MGGQTRTDNVDAPSAWQAWKVYLPLLLLRTILIASPGYLHPDELFQSVEPAAADAVGVCAFVPWELTHCDAPLRSALVIDFPAGLALRLASAILPDFPFCRGDARWMILAPRLLMLTLSVAADAVFVRVCERLGVDASVALPLLASSWVHLVMSTRTLSNGLEAVCVLLLLYALLAFSRSLRHSLGTCAVLTTTAGLAAIAVTGVFIRFTFAGYVGVCGAAAALWLLGRCSRRRGAAVLSVVLVAVASACATLGGLLAYEQVRFKGAVGVSTASWRTLAIPPLHMAEYNSIPEHFHRHGINPRWTHAVVNGLIMYGPMWLAWWATLAAGIATGLDHVSTVLHSLIAVPLALLSLAPHQEPRFLAPFLYLLPLAVLLGPLSRVLKSRAFWAVWLVFNVICVAFFGFVHQGGVLPAVAELSDAWARDCPHRPTWSSAPQFLSLLSGNAASSRESLLQSSVHVQGRGMYLPPLSLLRFQRRPAHRSDARMAWCAAELGSKWAHPGAAFCSPNVTYAGEDTWPSPSSVATRIEFATSTEPTQPSSAGSITAWPHFSAEAAGTEPADYTRGRVHVYGSVTETR